MLNTKHFTYFQDVYSKTTSEIKLSVMINLIIKPSVYAMSV